MSNRIVKINEEYYVDIDNLNYTLTRYGVKKEKEDGTFTKGSDVVLGYYPNMEQAINGLITKHNVPECHDLPSYIEAINSYREELIASIKELNL